MKINYAPLGVLSGIVTLFGFYAPFWKKLRSISVSASIGFGGVTLT